MRPIRVVTAAVVSAVALASPGALASSGLTEMVSVSSSGEQGDDGSGVGTAVSADGRYVAFDSEAANLVRGDKPGGWDVFVRDRLAGTTTRVSVDSAGRPGNEDSENPAITPDGRFVVFDSDASNLVKNDRNGDQDAFLHDRITGVTTRISLGNGGTEGEGQSFINHNVPPISADGRFVAFSSAAANLVPSDTNGHLDVFLRDLHTGMTTIVSRGAGDVQGNGDSFSAAISADGRFIAYGSFASNLVPGDANGVRDVLLYDRVTTETSLISVGTGGVEGNGASFNGSLSGDGRFAAFFSDATNLVASDANNLRDVFVHDRVTGATTMVSVNSEGIHGNFVSVSAAISLDGRRVAFESSSTNLVPGDTNSKPDVFMHDRTDGTTAMVSVASDGSQCVEPVLGNSPPFTFGSRFPAISGEGNAVTFASYCSNFAQDDTNASVDAFIHMVSP